MRISSRHIGRIGLRSAIVIASIFLSTAVLGTFFFLYNQYLTTKQLKAQLMDLASIAALQFNSVDIERVHTTGDMQSPSFNRLAKQLHDITQELSDVRFAYLMRRTDNPLKLSFIADSELYVSTEGIDSNHDGHIDSDEAPSLPGTEYDITDVPKLQGPAFQYSTTDDFFTGDQWGTFLSAYAPIQDSYGNTIAVLGLDMDALKFQRLSQSFFRPTVFLLVLLLGLMMTILVAVSIWKRQVESVLKLEEDRTALINLAMHQLGAPLAIVRWWLEILCESNECKKPNACHHCEICDEMKEGVARLVEVMAALKEVSELDSTKALTAQNPGLIDDALAIMQHDFASRLTSQQKKLVIEDHARHSLVALDKTLLIGILRELIGNALDYSPSGSTITLMTRDTTLGMRLDVRDTGYGIPRQDLENIFQKFSRGSNAMKYKTTGNGIGLYVVKSIVEKAGGKISIESELGKGTTVSITLPRMRA
jgi:signal transduction histidine kinase